MSSVHVDDLGSTSSGVLKIETFYAAQWREIYFFIYEDVQQCLAECEEFFSEMFGDHIELPNALWYLGIYYSNVDHNIIVRLVLYFIKGSREEKCVDCLVICDGTWYYCNLLRDMNYFIKYDGGVYRTNFKCRKNPTGTSIN